MKCFCFTSVLKVFTTKNQDIVVVDNIFVPNLLDLIFNTLQIVSALTSVP